MLKRFCHLRYFLWVVLGLQLLGCTSRGTSTSTAGSATDVQTDAKPSLGNIYSMPAQINFGKVKIGSKHKATFLIFNKAPVDVNQSLLGGLGMVSDSGAFRLDERACKSLPKDSSCKVTVTYQPQTAGTHHLTVKTLGRITNIETVVKGQAH